MGVLSWRRVRWLALGAVAGALAIGGIAYATIPDSFTGLVQGCYSANGSKGTGGTQLNIVDSNAANCSRGQTAVMLNGVPPHQFVRVGQSCSSGFYAHGITQSGSLACAPLPLPKAYGTTLDRLNDVDAFFIPIGSLSLPEAAQTYFVSAHVTVINVFHRSRWQCHLREGSSGGMIFDEAQAVTDGDTFATDISLQSQIRVTNASVWVTCTSGSDENNQIAHARIDAVQVAAG